MLNLKKSLALFLYIDNHFCIAKNSRIWKLLSFKVQVILHILPYNPPLIAQKWPLLIVSCIPFWTLSKHLHLYVDMYMYFSCFVFVFCFLLLISRISHYIYHYLYFLSTFLKTVYFCLALLSQPAIFYVGIIWNFVLDLCVHVCACVHAWVCVCVISFITNYPGLTEDLCVLLIWWLFATSCLIFTSTCVFEYMDVW